MPANNSKLCQCDCKKTDHHLVERQNKGPCTNPHDPPCTKFKEAV